MGQDKLIVRGAREHNLKNVDLELPRDRLIVITGLSGSGKSSLAFDTIYAEGQRRYVESLSAYARQFLGLMEKPDVDQIEGLSPAISIDQKGASRNPRSTVGTITEIYDYLRLLYARVGLPHCPNCGRVISAQTVPDLQRIYDSAPDVFQRLLGAPAAPDQAVRDFVDALKSPGRFQFGVLYRDELVGLADCKLDDEEEGLAHIGMLLLPPPYDDPQILGLVVRILERWLASEYAVRRIEVGAPASAATEMAFWNSQGYEFTGAQHRRELPGRAPRFLVMAKDIG